MKRNGCERERELAMALRRGELDPGLRDHARDCAECGELARVVVWLNRPPADDRRPQVADPAILRIKAQLLGTTAADQKILQPLHILQRAAFVALAFAWAALLGWKWDVIRDFSVERALVAAVEGSSISPSSLAVFVVLACATVLVTMHSALAGE